MIKEIPAMDMPEWLATILKNQSDRTFRLEDILQDSLFYPGGDLNGTPVKYLAGNIFSFVYTDHGISRDVLLKNLYGSDRDDGFNNYNLIMEDDINLDDITPGGWPPKKFKLFFEFHEIKPPYCHWSVWKRKEGVDRNVGPEGFSFFYAFAEMSELYEGLYNGLSIAPKILTLIDGGISFLPEDTDSNLWRIALSNQNGLPDYILNGSCARYATVDEACWTEYQGERIVQLPERYAGLWKLNQ